MSRWPSTLSLTLWTVTGAVLLLSGWGVLRSQTQPLQIGEPAPDLEIFFFEGHEWERQPRVDLEDLRGQIVVLNFWASWCIECRVEAADLENSWSRYRDDRVLFIGIAYADADSRSLAHLAEFNITYPSARDWGGRLSEAFGVTGTPETYVIDREGRLAHFQIGRMTEATLGDVLDTVVRSDRDQGRE